MPIRRHGKGWEVRVQHAGRRVSKTVATRSDAYHLESKLRQRANDSRAGRAPQYGLEEAFERWLTGEAASLKSPQTALSVSRMIFPHIRGRMLSEVVDVAALIEAAGRKDGKLPATINRRLAALRRVAKLAYRKWGWLENDLGAKIQLLPGERKRTEFVTVQQGRRLIAAARGPVREVIRWALLTGLRRGELFGLTAASFRQGSIHLPGWTTKSGKERNIPLPPELDPKRFPFGMNYHTFEKHWNNARRLARMPHIRFHDLRRSYGTWLLQGGADLAAVRDLLGHSTITMTSRYLGASSTDLKRAVSALPGLSRGRKAIFHR